MLDGTQYRFLRSIAGKTWRDKISYVDLLHLITKDAYNTNFDWAYESDVKRETDHADSDTLIMQLAWGEIAFQT